MKIIPNTLRLGPLDGHSMDNRFDPIASFSGSVYRRTANNQYLYDPSMSQDQRTKDERIEAARIADKWDPPKPKQQSERVVRWNPFNAAGVTL